MFGVLWEGVKMKTKQLFVRARDKWGKWGTHDFLCLTTDSKLNFLAGRMIHHEMVVVVNDKLAGDDIELQATCEGESCSE